MISYNFQALATQIRNLKAEAEARPTNGSVEQAKILARIIKDLERLDQMGRI